MAFPFSTPWKAFLVRNHPRGHVKRLSTEEGLLLRGISPTFWEGGKRMCNGRSCFLATMRTRFPCAPLREPLDEEIWVDKGGDRDCQEILGKACMADGAPSPQTGVHEDDLRAFVFSYYRGSLRFLPLEFRKSGCILFVECSLWSWDKWEGGEV